MADPLPGVASIAPYQRWFRWGRVPHPSSRAQRGVL